MFKRVLQCFLFLSLPFLLTAQSAREQYLNESVNENQLSREQWEKAVNGIDYTSSKKKETTRQPRARNYPTERRPPSISFGSGAWAAFAKFILILGGIVLLALLLRYLLGYEGFRRNKKITPSANAEAIDLEQIEENIHETDLERYIRQALESKQFALAIRLYYLHILKELSQLKHIKWKKDKTNRTYLNEMSSSPFNQSFRQLTLIFERVWYGNGELDEADFNALEPHFKTFLQQLNPTTA